MSGCLQVGSVRSLGSYFSLQSMPNITHINTRSYFTGLCVYMPSSWLTTAAIFHSFTRSFYHRFSSSAPPFSLSHSLPSSLFPCFKHLSACDLCSHFYFTPQYIWIAARKKRKTERGGRYTVGHCSTWRTGEQVRLICPEMAFKPVLIFTFWGVCQLQCTDTPQWTPQDGP